jgi:cytochrome c551/c552
MKSSYGRRSRGTGDTKPFLCSRIALVITALSALLFSASTSSWGQDAATFFKQNCTSCHTVGGGRLTGPDLKDVATRKDRTWLVQFLQSPKAMIDSGDPYATKLQQEARGVVMPNIAGMSPPQAQALLDMITAESKLPHSQFAGMQISDRPLTAPISHGFMSGCRGARDWRHGCRRQRAPPCHRCSRTMRSSQQKSSRSWPCLKTPRKEAGRMTPLPC